MARYETVDEYLADLPDAHRETLEKIRKQIKALYPRATENISFGKPMFELDGHPLGGVRGAKNHCGLFVWSETALDRLGDMLDGYDTASSTIRFPPGEPLPEHVVKAVLDIRVKEIEERWS